MRWWKILGLAGFAGVAATGAVIVRSERARRAYTPDEIREQLHARLAAAGATGPSPGGATGPSPGLPPAARHPARVDGSAQRAAGPGSAAADATAARRLPGWRHGPRRPPRHYPRLRPHRR